MVTQKAHLRGSGGLPGSHALLITYYQDDEAVITTFLRSLGSWEALTRKVSSSPASTGYIREISQGVNLFRTKASSAM